MAAQPLDNEPTGTTQAVRVVVDECTTMLAVVRSSCDNIQRMVWQSPYGNTPQQLCTALNSRAKALITVMQAANTLIATLRANLRQPGAAPLDLKPAGAVVTANADGTVTITGV